MTKNTKGGKGHKKRGRKFTRPNQRDLKLKDKDQEYAKLIANKGDCRFECLCTDGKTRTAHVPGSFRNRIWMRVDDIVLISIRIGISVDHCDILYKYNVNEIRQLEEKGLISKITTDLEKQMCEEEMLLEEQNVTAETKENEQITISVDLHEDNIMEDAKYKEYIDML